MGVFCTQCGAAARDEDKFCKQCGSPVDHSEPSETPTAEPASAQPVDSTSCSKGIWESSKDGLDSGSDGQAVSAEDGPPPPISASEQFQSVFSAGYDVADKLAVRNLGPVSGAARGVSGLRDKSPVKQTVAWVGLLVVFAFVFMGVIIGAVAVSDAVSEANKMSCEEYLDEVYLANEATGMPGPPSETRAADERYMDLVMRVDEFCPEDER